MLVAKIGYYNFQFLVQYVKCMEAMTPVLTMMTTTKNPDNQQLFLNPLDN